MGLKYAIVYLDLKPEYAKLYNLPIKMPVLVEDMKKITDKNKLPLDIILRGLEAQYKISKDDYYKSYLVYFYYEAFKKALNNNDFENANLYLNKAKKLGGEDYRFNFYRALLLKKSDQDELAELELKEAIVKNPNFYLGHFELGNLMFERKIYEEALEAFKNAIELNPEFVIPHLKIADIYIENGLFSEAIDELNEILKKDPNFAAAYVRLGIIFNQLQRFEDALQIQEKGLAKDPENYELLYNIAYTYAKLGRHREATKRLEKAAKIHEEDYILHELAISYRNIGEYLKAFETAKKALEISSEENKELILLLLVKLAAIIGDIEETKKYYTLLKNTEFEISAKTFYMFSLLSNDNIELAKKISLELYNYGIYGNIHLIIDNIDSYIDYLETHTDKNYTEALIESFNDFGDIDKLGLYRNLKKNNIDIINIIKDDVNEVVDGIELLLNAYLLSGIDYGLSERVSTLLANFIWKDGKGILISRFLLRYYQDRVFGNFSSLDVFVNDIIEEMKDLHFELARVISDYEINLIDFDELLEYNLTNLEDIIKIILSYMHIQPTLNELNSSHFEDSRIKKILLWAKYLDDLIKVLK